MGNFQGRKLCGLVESKHFVEKIFTEFYTDPTGGLIMPKILWNLRVTFFFSFKFPAIRYIAKIYGMLVLAVVVHYYSHL